MRTHAVLVLDTSLTATGYAVVRLPLERTPNGGTVNPVVRGVADAPLMGAIVQKDATVATNLRLAALARNLGGLIDTAGRWGHPIDFVVAETPDSTFEKAGRAKNMQSIMAQQRAFGAVAVAVVGTAGLPLVEVSPNDAKLAFCGQRNAKKETVQRLIDLQIPDLFERVPGKKLTKVEREAIVDALAVAYWADAQLRLAEYGHPSGLDGAVAHATLTGV